jgi:hypothetical protein
MRKTTAPTSMIIASPCPDDPLSRTSDKNIPVYIHYEQRPNTKTSLSLALCPSPRSSPTPLCHVVAIFESHSSETPALFASVLALLAILPAILLQFCFFPQNYVRTNKHPRLRMHKILCHRIDMVRAEGRELIDPSKHQAVSSFFSTGGHPGQLTILQSVMLPQDLWTTGRGSRSYK